MAADSSANRFVAVPGTAAEKGAFTMGEGAVKAKDWAAAATKAGCKPVLSIGGWSGTRGSPRSTNANGSLTLLRAGSNTFSGLMATDTSRSDFVNTISAALDANGFGAYTSASLLSEETADFPLWQSARTSTGSIRARLARQT